MTDSQDGSHNGRRSRDAMSRACTIEENDDRGNDDRGRASRLLLLRKQPFDSVSRTRTDYNKTGATAYTRVSCTRIRSSNARSRLTKGVAERDGSLAKAGSHFCNDRLKPGPELSNSCHSQAKVRRRLLVDGHVCRCFRATLSSASSRNLSNQRTRQLFRLSAVVLEHAESRS